MRSGLRIAELLAGAWRRSPPAAAPSPEVLVDLGPVLLATGAAGVAWWRISQTPLRDLPAARPLRQAYRLTAVQAVVHDRQIERAFELLGRAAVRALLGKGWAIARGYPSPGLRPYGDLDLYVPAAQYVAAKAALSGPDGGGCAVDLHRGFAELDDRDEAELFGHSREVAAGGQRARVFGPEDHLRLLALHMLRHGVLRPVWLCDVALALESRPSDFDWAWFLAGDPRRRRWAVCALGLAHQLLGASLDGVPVADEAKRIPAWLAPSVLGEWSSPRAPQGARTPMAEELRHPSRLLRAMRLRWPNAIEATVDVGGPFNEWPRLPLQLAECLLRSMRFTRRLPALVSGRE